MNPQHRPPVIIGLTGGIGSGKSTVANLFNELGVESIDADDIAREVVEPGEPCLKEIVSVFGQEVLTSNGQLNRAALREIVFSSQELRKQLEAITHPAIRERMHQKLLQCHGKIALMVHPLLFETGQNKECKYTIAISTPKSLQIERVTLRDNNSAEQVERIINTQLSDPERCSKADFILENTSNCDELSVRVFQLYNKLQTILF